MTDWGGARRGRSGRPRDEDGSISLFILGLALIAMLLVAGAVAVTSAHLSRMRLLDVADGAALSAANALDDSAYDQGVGESVPLSNRSVQERAAVYLGSRPRPGSIREWRLAPGTGTPDGRTAVVVVVGEAELPMIGPALRDLGVAVTIRVESRARSDVVP
ncbi:MAG TPA: Tad domain-containing protein [Ornithinibacter sp.]|nr:Tad domain-containing protein [Ornithinibacter sp.]